MMLGVNGRKKAGSNDPAWKKTKNADGYCLVRPLMVISMLCPTRIP
jgi:hypothetical protein